MAPWRQHVQHMPHSEGVWPNSPRLRTDGGGERLRAGHAEWCRGMPA